MMGKKKISKNLIKFSDSYFEKRSGNDHKRMKSFILEKKLVEKYSNLNGKVCDVGCSTGEFLKFIKWKGQRFGMEINELAKKKAKKNSINFSKNILNTSNFFDVIIFRGTIQHLDQPFLFLNYAHKALKKNGTMFFLATPNVGSVYYRLFQDLPALDKRKNFYLPSSKNLTNICKIIGFKKLYEQYPYLKSGYEKPIKDLIFFLIKCLGLMKNYNFSFPGNMMNLVFKK